jgi:hypothetical protein
MRCSERTPVDCITLKRGQSHEPFVPAKAVTHARITTATKRTIGGALRLRFVARPLRSPPPASACERWGGVRGGGMRLVNAVPDHSRPPPGASPSAPRHPPHRHSASKTRVNALSAGGGMVPAAPSRLKREMCACPSAKAGTQGNRPDGRSEWPRGSCLRGNERDEAAASGIRD